MKPGKSVVTSTQFPPFPPLRELFFHTAPARSLAVKFSGSIALLPPQSLRGTCAGRTSLSLSRLQVAEVRSWLSLYIGAAQSGYVVVLPIGPWSFCRWGRGWSAGGLVGVLPMFLRFVGPIFPAQQCGEAGARGLALAHRRAGGPGSAPSLRVREAPVWASPLRGALCLRGAPEVAKRWRRLPPTAGAVAEHRK